MKEKKYILLEDNTKVIDGVKLYRVKYNEDFIKTVPKMEDFIDKIGHLGGYIEKEDNLSQEGNCWIDKESIVMENAKVIDNACLIKSTAKGNSIISGNSEVSVLSTISGNVIIEGSPKVCLSKIQDNVRISDDAFVYESTIKDNCKIFDNATVYECTLSDYTMVFGHAMVHYSTKINGNSMVFGDANLTYGSIEGNTLIYDRAMIGPSNIKDATIFGKSRIDKYAIIIEGAFYDTSRAADKLYLNQGNINTSKISPISDAVSLYIKSNSFYSSNLLIIETIRAARRCNKIITLLVNDKYPVVINKTVDKKKKLIRYDIIIMGKISYQTTVTNKEDNDTLYKKIVEIVDNEFFNYFLSTVEDN